VGKWHLSPVSEFSQRGPFDHWPLGMGFERFYGFVGGETNQFYPDLVYDNHLVDPPKTPEEGYHLTEDLTDKAIEFIRDTLNVDPDAPFCMYLSYGANHAPHHTHKEWREKYKGAFDMGWDNYREQVLENQKKMGIVPENTELSPRPDFIPAWDSLTDVQKKVYAAFMENFAGFASHLDFNIGRFIDFLSEAGQLDNTLIVVVSDNGASAEGGPDGTISEDLFWNYIFQTPSEMLPKLDVLIPSAGRTRGTRPSSAGNERALMVVTRMRSLSIGLKAFRQKAVSAANITTLSTWYRPFWKPLA
jgi:arylsulfatase